MIKSDKPDIYGIKSLGAKDLKFDFETKYSLLFLLIINAVFNLLLANRFFPITEGWFQDFNNYIYDGKVAYKDFYMFLTPVFPYLMALVGKLFGGTFIAFRFFGICERLILITLVYFIIRRIYANRITFIALLTASSIYISNVQDIFYGYYQTSLLLGIVTLYFAIKLHENLHLHSIKYSILFGLAAGITFSTKQSTGAIIVITLSLGLIVLNWRQNSDLIVKRILIALLSGILVVGFMVALLFSTGAFQPFLEQVFGGASSKGSLLHIFFGFLPNMMCSTTFWVTFSIVMVYIFHSISIIKNRNVEKTLQVISILIFSVIIYYLCLLEIPFVLIFKGLNIFVVIFLFLVLSGFIFLWTRIIKQSNLKSLIGYTLAFVSIVVCLSLISKEPLINVNMGILRDKRQFLIYALFFYELIFLGYLIFKRIQSKENSDDIKILILIAAWVIMYVHGMSGTIEDHGTLLAFCILFGELLSLKTSLNLLKNGLVYAFCIITFFGIFLQRNNFPYWWWGVYASPATYQAKYKFDDPKLAGMYSDKTITKEMNRVYWIMKKNQQSNDNMYSFPHINYFNVMADLKTPTKAKVHYFDVCADFMAQADAKILKSNKPKFIIWQDLPESTWAIHEKLFRAENRCGQRDIQDVYKELTASGVYKLLGVFHLNQADPIYLWGLKDGRTWVNENGEVIK